MSIIRTIQRLAAAALSVGILLATSAAPGQEPDRSLASPPKTLSARLQGIEHVGMLFHSGGEDLDGFKLYVYSAEQQKRNRQAKAEYGRQREEAQARERQLRERLTAARSSGDTTREEMQAIAMELRNINRPAIRGNLGHQHLLRVIAVGDDYIEVEAMENPEGSTIYPLRSLLRVTFVKDSVEPEE